MTSTLHNRRHSRIHLPEIDVVDPEYKTRGVSERCGMKTVFNHFRCLSWEDLLFPARKERPEPESKVFEIEGYAGQCGNDDLDEVAAAARIDIQKGRSSSGITKPGLWG
jgi:hypothetical protein